MNRSKELLKSAVEAMGSQSKLARALGISQQGVSYIINHAQSVPVEVAVGIHRLTNGKISKADLRPDIFGDAA